MQYDLDVLHSGSDGLGKGKKKRGADDDMHRTDRDLDALHQEGGWKAGGNRAKKRGQDNARQRQFQKRAAREWPCVRLCPPAPALSPEATLSD